MERVISMSCAAFLISFMLVGCSDPQPTNIAADADKDAIAEYEAAIAAEASVNPDEEGE